MTLHTHVLADGWVEGRDYIENSVMYYDGKPRTQHRNLQRFQELLQERLTQAMASANGPTELQTDTIAAIAHAMRHSVATLPAVTYPQAAIEPAARSRPAYMPY